MVKTKYLAPRLTSAEYALAEEVASRWGMTLGVELCLSTFEWSFTGPHDDAMGAYREFLRIAGW